MVKNRLLRLHNDVVGGASEHVDKGYLDLPQQRGVLPVRDSYPALRGRLLLRDAAGYQPILD